MRHTLTYELKTTSGKALADPNLYHDYRIWLNDEPVADGSGMFRWTAKRNMLRAIKRVVRATS